MSLIGWKRLSEIGVAQEGKGEKGQTWMGGQRIRKHDRSGMGRIEDKMLSMGRMKGGKRDSEVD